jgi:branched-chain amino acid transport system permease protein
MNRFRKWVIFFMFLLALSLLVRNQPFWGHLIFMVFLYGTVAGAWNLSGGYGGQISLGHAIFFGLGAYTSTLLFMRLDISPWYGMILGSLLAVIFSLAIGGILIWRLKTHFFALATVAVAQVILLLTMYFKNLTGGSEGLPVPVRGGAYNFIFQTKYSYILIAFLLLAVVTIISEIIKSKKLGYQLIAGREDEDAAESLGIPIFKCRVFTFAISAFFVALAGTLYVQYSMFADPHVSFGFGISIKMALLAIIGGLGTVQGPLIGSALLTPLEILFRSWLGGKFAGFDILFNGVILIAVVLYFSGGIMAGVKQSKWLSRKSKKEKLDKEQSLEISLAEDHGKSLSFISSPSIPFQGDSVILRIENVNKQFGGLVAMRNVSLTVKKGELVGIIGPNGAGKTTLFNLISGFLPPDGGKIEIKGKKISDRESPHEICLNHHTARTFQLVRPFNNMTVLENILIGAICRLDNIQEARTRAEEVMEFTGLAKYGDTLVSNLPVALKKRIEIARSLATAPELLLLDEPVVGLNPEEVKEAIEFIRTISKQGITVIIIEHVMKAIMDLSERILVLHHGEKIAEGTPLEISSNQEVIRVYMGESI